MNAGKLRQRVTIQRPTYTRNEDGERIESLQDVRTVWAWARRIRASERAQAGAAGQVVAEADWRVTLRVDPNNELLPTDVIVYDGRRLDIISIVDVDEEGVMLEVDCRERGA